MEGRGLSPNYYSWSLVPWMEKIRRGSVANRSRWHWDIVEMHAFLLYYSHPCIYEQAASVAFDAEMQVQQICYPLEELGWTLEFSTVSLWTLSNVAKFLISIVELAKLSWGPEHNCMFIRHPHSHLGFGGPHQPLTNSHSYNMIKCHFVIRMLLTVHLKSIQCRLR